MRHASSPESAADTADTAAYGLLVLRLALGLMWIAHALLKLLVFGLPGTAQYFASIGFPAWVAYPVFGIELLGGIALLLGLYARQVALALTPILLGAAWVHLPNGWVHTSTGGGWEYPVFLALASLTIWLSGDGAAALLRSSFAVPVYSPAEGQS
ncbi:DoxX family membrane protein [Pelomonas sp. SE-A7]|uniref:DoxX family protein n=1 Tax=Pelomonas sp. SE-A7 TaxID=3054953 RepID=UPI00259CC7FB|nr:DoxX family membrane protein [Pelomonas sp. SE-A7]MDM4766283.1 DoxX family membrane protein [Pelomonas sp. SE-A7]